jgi:hypothetical protein
MKKPANQRSFLLDQRLNRQDDHRQVADFSSSCRVTGVSSLNLALPPPVCRAFFLVAGLQASVTRFLLVFGNFLARHRCAAQHISNSARLSLPIAISACRRYSRRGRTA